jgi:hypothetical protein
LILEEISMMQRLAQLVLAGLSLWAAAASASTDPILVTAPVTKVFVPGGFDSNDDAEVIVHGHFLSWCYKLGPIEADVDTANGRIVIRPQAWLYPEGICHEVRVPYVASVKLGPLAPGNYSVEVRGERTLSAALPVVEATASGPDVFVYAPVDTIEWIETTPGRYVIRVSGTHAEVEDGCLSIAEMRLVRSGTDTFVVMPIAQIESDPGICIELGFDRFAAEVEVPYDVEPGEYLVHVRALAGQSVNRLVKVRPRRSGGGGY